MEQRELVLAHSPDADDAFMFYALATRKLRPPVLSFRHVLSDIETLNRQAMEAKFDLTAISFHAYPYVAERYRLLSTGSSMGDGYGPLLVSTRLFSAEELKGKKVAVPGLLTTAWLVLKLFESEVEPVVVPFDKIFEALREGRAEAGLLIHEGQLTYDPRGLASHRRPGTLVATAAGFAPSAGRPGSGPPSAPGRAGRSGLTRAQQHPVRPGP